MDDAGKELLSCPGFAEEKHAALGVRYLPDLIEDALERRAFADDAAEIIVPSDLPFEEYVLRLKALLQKGVPHDLLDLLMDNGLHDVIIGPGPERLHRGIERCVGCDDNKYLVWDLLAHPDEHLDPVHPRQDDVRDDHIINVRFKQVEAFFGAVRSIDCESLFREDPLDGFPQSLLVLNDHNAL